MYDATGSNARHLAGFARRNGLDAQVAYDNQRGWVCKVATPWHDEPQLMRDTTDVAMLAAEIDRHDTPPPAA